MATKVEKVEKKKEVVLPQVPKMVQNAVTVINRKVSVAAVALIDIGKSLITLKDQCKHGEWERLFKGAKNVAPEYLNMTSNNASHLMQIARNKALADPVNALFLPVSMDALYQLAQIEDEALKQAIADKKVTAMTTGDTARKLKEELDPDAVKPEPRSARVSDGTETLTLSPEPEQHVATPQARSDNGGKGTPATDLDQAIGTLEDMVNKILSASAAGKLLPYQQEIALHWADKLIAGLNPVVAEVAKDITEAVAAR